MGFAMGMDDAMLHVLQGAQQGRAFPLRAPEMSLGREGGALDLSGYRQMSRQHARLSYASGAWSVQDLGSTNGTRVNGERIVTRRLHDGDVLQMGDFSARVSLPSAPGSTPGAARTELVTDSPPTQLVPPAPQNFPSSPPWPQQTAPQQYPSYPPPAFPPQPQYHVHNYVVTPPKNPGLAAVLSFFFCGLGQFYNGEMGKGIAFLVGGILVWMFACFGAWLLAPALWIWSIVDAYQSAEQINRRSQV